MKIRFLIISITMSGMLLFLAGCGDLGYYWSCLQGQLDVLNRAQPVDTLLVAADTSPDLRSRLEQAKEIRDFASRALSLPDNDSYRRYANLERDYAVWNVVSSPEFSLEPQNWCFPIAGCVSYRGFFSEDEADRFAAGLQDGGNDVFRYGVAAYSTLNWFDDPILNTFWRRSNTSLASLIFHELSHQVVYLPGASDFNEAFATSVEIVGTLRWLENHNDSKGKELFKRHYELNSKFQQLARTCRETLGKLYLTSLSDNEKRGEKARILRDFQNLLRDLGREYGNEQLFSSWLGDDLNNARFALLSTYHDLVPAFLNLLAVKNYNLEKFFIEVERLSKLPKEERLAVLNHLQSLKLYASLWDIHRS
ncbi:MAG: aminopeptidase [Desulfuromonas sp.]|nr:MAG: aminopeptidase [Desulfuromonas sp.]